MNVGLNSYLSDGVLWWFRLARYRSLNRWRHLKALGCTSFVANLGQVGAMMKQRLWIKILLSVACLFSPGVVWFPVKQQEPKKIKSNQGKTWNNIIICLAFSTTNAFGFVLPWQFFGPSPDQSRHPRDNLWSASPCGLGNHLELIASRSMGAVAYFWWEIWRTPDTMRNRSVFRVPERGKKKKNSPARP